MAQSENGNDVFSHSEYEKLGNKQTQKDVLFAPSFYQLEVEFFNFWDHLKWFKRGHNIDENHLCG